MVSERNPFSKSFIRTLRRIPRVVRGEDAFYRPEVTVRTRHHGSDYGGWTLCPERLDSNSIVYSFGVGDDITFDLAVIDAYQAQVQAFDPTPRVREWLASQELPPQFHYLEYGVSDYDGSAMFYAPQNSRHVSHSMIRIDQDQRPYIEIDVRRIETLMKMLGHSRVDLLKMDVEGAEYQVIESLGSISADIGQLLIEFHHRFPQVGFSRTKTAIASLKRMGFKMFAVSATGEEFSFIRC